MKKIRIIYQIFPIVILINETNYSVFSQQTNPSDLDFIKTPEIELREEGSFLSDYKGNSSGLAFATGFSHLYLKDSYSIPVIMVGGGLYAYFKSGSYIGFDVYGWFGKRDFNRTVTTNWGNPSGEFYRDFWSVWLIRYKQHISSNFYPSVGVGFFEYGQNRSYTRGTGPIAGGGKAYLSWSLGLDYKLTEKIMLGSHWISVTKVDIDEHVGPGGWGISFDVMFTLPKLEWSELSDLF